MPKREPRFNRSQILQAMEDAGLTAQQQQDVLGRLQGLLPKRGRPEEDDEQGVEKVVELAGWNEEQMTFNAAAATVARALPKEERDAARKRLARKAKEKAATRREEAVEAPQEEPGARQGLAKSRKRFGLFDAMLSRRMDIEAARRLKKPP